MKRSALSLTKASAPWLSNLRARFSFSVNYFPMSKVADVVLDIESSIALRELSFLAVAHLLYIISDGQVSHYDLTCCNA